MPEISEEMKTALRKIMDMQAELADLTKQYEEKETRIEEIEEEQDRIRKNMRELDRQSSLYRDYVEKFTNQEKEFETLRAEMKQLREQLTAKMKALQDYIMGLNIK